MKQTASNVFDKLLYYSSHVGKLTWMNFKQATKCLTRDKGPFKASTCLTSLARLGHLDFDPMNLSDITAAPASLVETAIVDRYVLIGARTPSFLDNIRKSVSSTGGKFQSIAEQYSSKTIVLSELTEASLVGIESLGVHISLTFSAKLANVLPTPEYPSFPHSETAFPDSLTKFNLNSLEYDKLDNHQSYSDGLYEIPQYGPSVYILKSGPNQRRVPRDWGEWLALSISGKTTGLISYEEKSRTWCVRRKLRVPLLVDRCATLCSGYPPRFISKFTCYQDIPAGIAYRLTKSLYQDWELA